MSNLKVSRLDSLMEEARRLVLVVGMASYRIGRIALEIKEGKLWEGSFRTFNDCCRAMFPTILHGQELTHFRHLVRIAAAFEEATVKEIGVTRAQLLLPLLQYPAEVQAAALQAARRMTVRELKAHVEELRGHEPRAVSFDARAKLDSIMRQVEKLGPVERLVLIDRIREMGRRDVSDLRRATNHKNNKGRYAA